jgi:hypothetical protein
MPVVMIAVAGTAANFGRGTVQQGHNYVVGQALALDAIVVEFVAKSQRHLIASSI